MMPFQVGERVICTAPYDGNYDIVGMVGTVCGPINDIWCGVEFEAAFPRGHDCHGMCLKGYGWDCEYGVLEPYNEPETATVVIMPYEELNI